jgi:hypothetical protein
MAIPVDCLQFCYLTQWQKRHNTTFSFNIPVVSASSSLILAVMSADFVLW